MFDQNVAITVGSVTTNYGLVSIKDGASIRSNAGSEIGIPDVLTISHETKGKGSGAVDRHLVRIDTTKKVSNGDGSVSKQIATAYLVLVVPQEVVTKADVSAAYAKLLAFLSATEAGATASNLNRILNNEP